MKLSRKTLTFAVFLVAALLSISEAPEILTLTDDISNDCESVQITSQSSRQCIVKESADQVVPAPAPFSDSASDRRASVYNSPWSLSSLSTDTLLLLLVTQRK